jgi:hypothetical protein
MWVEAKMTARAFKNFSNRWDRPTAILNSTMVGFAGWRATQKYMQKPFDRSTLREKVHS